MDNQVWILTWTLNPSVYAVDTIRHQVVFDHKPDAKAIKEAICVFGKECSIIAQVKALARDNAYLAVKQGEADLQALYFDDDLSVNLLQETKMRRHILGNTEIKLRHPKMVKVISNES